MAQGRSDTILVAIRIMLRIRESKVRNPDPPYYSLIVSCLVRRRFVLSERILVVNVVPVCVYRHLSVTLVLFSFVISLFSLCLLFVILRNICFSCTMCPLSRYIYAFFIYLLHESFAKWEPSICVSYFCECKPFLNQITYNWNFFDKALLFYDISRMDLAGFLWIQL